MLANRRGLGLRQACRMVRAVILAVDSGWVCYLAVSACCLVSDLPPHRFTERLVELNEALPVLLTHGAHSSLSCALIGRNACSVSRKRTS